MYKVEAANAEVAMSTPDETLVEAIEQTGREVEESDFLS